MSPFSLLSPHGSTCSIQNMDWCGEISPCPKFPNIWVLNKTSQLTSADASYMVLNLPDTCSHFLIYLFTVSSQNPMGQTQWWKCLLNNIQISRSHSATACWRGHEKTGPLNSPAPPMHPVKCCQLETFSETSRGIFHLAELQPTNRIIQYKNLKLF